MLDADEKIVKKRSFQSRSRLEWLTGLKHSSRKDCHSRFLSTPRSIIAHTAAVLKCDTLLSSIRQRPHKMTVLLKKSLDEKWENKKLEAPRARIGGSVRRAKNWNSTWTAADQKDSSSAGCLLQWTKLVPAAARGSQNCPGIVIVEHVGWPKTTKNEGKRIYFWPCYLVASLATVISYSCYNNEKRVHVLFLQQSNSCLCHSFCICWWETSRLLFRDRHIPMVLMSCTRRTTVARRKYRRGSEFECIFRFCLQSSTASARCRAESQHRTLRSFCLSSY